ncbi:unnamed protein product [Polarella glacialis]|uniref:Uncharacterized protein n=1 Tax=Polarella glacialis TaxID=89957 RepID=A0A813L2R2_POLGL|nr:unnamed protein product [Polarella glacialis]
MPAEQWQPYIAVIVVATVVVVVVFVVALVVVAVHRRQSSVSLASMLPPGLVCAGPRDANALRLPTLDANGADSCSLRTRRAQIARCAVLGPPVLAHGLLRGHGDQVNGLLTAFCWQS